MVMVEDTPDNFVDDLSDCSTDDNVSELTLTDSSSESGDFKECNGEAPSSELESGEPVCGSELASDETNTASQTVELTQVKVPDEVRFQQLQKEIDLLNDLMFKAEDKTEKCNTLYNSFTSEINNFMYNGIDDSPRCDDFNETSNDLENKFENFSEKSEPLFSDFEKNSPLFSDYDKNSVDCESIDFNCKDSITQEIECPDKEIKSESHYSLDTLASFLKSQSENGFEGDNISEGGKTDSLLKDEGNECYSKCNIPVEDRIFLLWNQISSLKCAIKSIRLNLKEQQMDTLMQINEFLINQEIEKKNTINEKESELLDQSSIKQEIPSDENNITICDSFKNINSLHIENNPKKKFFSKSDSLVKKNIAVNSFKIALLECSMLSLTATSLLNSIPQAGFNNTGTSILSLESNKHDLPKDLKSLKTNQNSKYKLINKRYSFLPNYNLKEIESEQRIHLERKVKSEMKVKQPKQNTRLCLSDCMVSLDGKM